MADVDDPRCPECGGPIGQTATYCMHCSADLTEELEAVDENEDGRWEGTAAGSTGTLRATAADHTRSIVDVLGISRSTAGEGAGRLLDPDGLVDDTLTVAVGIAGGIVVGVVGTIVLGAVTGSGAAIVFGIVVWLGATAYLVRRRTVQGAIAKSAYAVTVVLLSVPVIAISPAVSVDGGAAERGGLFFVLLLFVALPAAVAAAIGWVASRFVPNEDSGTDR